MPHSAAALPLHTIEARPARRAPAATPRLRRRVTLVKRLLWLVATLVGIEVVYLIAGNLFLCFGLLRLVNQSPDETMMAFESAYTMLPGVAHVRGFRMRSQDRATQWVLDIEEADLTVELRDLVHRSFHASDVRASGVRFRLRRKLTEEGADGLRAAALPAIPGFADPPLLPVGPPALEAVDEDWTAHLEGVRASVREIWVDEWRLVGPATVTGGFFKGPHILQVGPARLEVQGGEVRIAERQALTGLDARVDAIIGAIDMRWPITRAAREISWRGTVDAQVPSVDFVRLYLGALPAVALEDGSGPLHVELGLRHGRAVPPSRLTIESDHLVLVRGALEITSSFAFEARIEGGAAGPLATADLHVRRARIALGGREGEPPVIEDGHARFRGLPLELAGAVEIERTELDLPVRFPDLGWLLPPRRRGEERPVTLSGAASARARVELDRRLVASGVVEARADHAVVTARRLGVDARLSARAAFDGADWRTRSVTLRSGEAIADQVAITSAGRTHGGGTARVDLLAGRVAEGVPRDFTLTTEARHPDLSWLAYASARGGVSARAGDFRAKLEVPRPASLLDGSPADAAVTGSIASFTSGDARYGDTRLRLDVRTTATIEALDLGRRKLRLGQVHVTVRDVAIDRGTSHTRGWWGDFDAPRFEGSVGRSVELAAHVDSRCQSGAPVNALLTSGGIIPGWVGSVFPMKDLRVTGQVSLRRGAVGFGLRALGSSATVTADVNDANRAPNGVVLVETPVVSLGVRFRRGEHQVQVFAGEAWLDERIEAVKAEQAAE